MSSSNPPQLSPTSIYYGTTGDKPEVSVVVTPSYGSPNNSIYVQVYLWQGAVGQGTMVSEVNIPYMLDIKNNPNPPKSDWQTQTISGLGVKADIEYMYDKKYNMINMSIKMHGPSATYFISNPIGSMDISKLSDGDQCNPGYYAGPGPQPERNGLTSAFNFSYNDGNYSVLGAVGPYTTSNQTFKDSTEINVGGDGYSLNGTLTANGNVILFTGQIVQGNVALIGFNNAVVGSLTTI